MLLKICIWVSIYLMIGNLIDMLTRKGSDQISSLLIMVTWPILIVMTIAELLKRCLHD